MLKCIGWERAVRRSDIQLHPQHRRLIYATTILLFVSGLAWWWLDRFGETPGEFGAVKNPLQHPVLVLHGVTALGYLLLLGSLGTAHIRRGWSVRKQRAQAVFLLALQGLLVLTAAGLYYIGHEGLRSWVSDAHLTAGLLLGAALPLHIWLGRRSNRPPA